MALRMLLTRVSVASNAKNLVQARSMFKSSARLEKPVVSVKAAEAPPSDTSRLGPLLLKVKPYQKYVLVWTGKYKSVEEVPEKLSHSVLDTALNKARVKLSIYMMGVTALGCLGFVYMGKQMAKEGDSLAKRTMEQHAQLREEARKEKLQAEAATATK